MFGESILILRRMGTFSNDLNIWKMATWFTFVFDEGWGYPRSKSYTKLTLCKSSKINFFISPTHTNWMVTMSSLGVMKKHAMDTLS